MAILLDSVVVVDTAGETAEAAVVDEILTVVADE